MNTSLYSVDDDKIDKIRISDAVKRCRFGGPFYLIGFCASAGYSELAQAYSTVVGVFVALFLVLMIYRVILAISLAGAERINPKPYFVSLAIIYISSALVWAASVGWLFVVNPIIDLSIVVILVSSAGLITGGVAALIPYRKLLSIYCLLMCVPLMIFSLFFLAGTGNSLIAVLISAYTLYVWLVGLQQSDIYTKALEDNILLSVQALELEKAKIEAEKAGEAKADFLAAMTHEIRTPMSGVLGMTQLLSMGDLKEEHQQQVSVINNAGIALLHIIDDILDYSKINADKLLLSKQRFDPQDVVNEVVQLLRGEVEKKGVKLVSNIHSPKQSVEGDRYRLHQVLSNLVANAIKFTDSGTITIDLLTENDLSSPICKVSLSVADTGIGISPSHQERIFEQFYQVSKFNPDIRGSGLGLSITKQLVELMGGTITLQSTEGQGSTFTAVIPMALVERGSDDKLNEAGSTQNNRHGSEEERSELSSSIDVLLVEDNPASQMVCQGMLEKLSCTVDVVESGVEAITQVLDKQYAAIFMDCNLPSMGGFEATQRIRQLEMEQQRPKVPIIALTAHVQEDIKQRCFDAGMTGFLSKPFLFEALKKHVDDIKSQA